MSQHKRYSLNPVLVWLPGADIVGIDNIMEVTHASMECKQDEGGKWVLHSDYAALSTENDRLRKHLNDLSLWSQDVRFAFQMNEDTPPSIGYMLDYSMKNNVPFHMPPMTWSFSKETVHILFKGLNEIDAKHGGSKIPLDLA